MTTLAGDGQSPYAIALDQDQLDIMADAIRQHKAAAKP